MLCSNLHCQKVSIQSSVKCAKWTTLRGSAARPLTDPPGHLLRDKWTALSGPLAGRVPDGRGGDGEWGAEARGRNHALPPLRRGLRAHHHGIYIEIYRYIKLYIQTYVYIYIYTCKYEYVYRLRYIYTTR